MSLALRTETSGWRDSVFFLVAGRTYRNIWLWQYCFRVSVCRWLGTWRRSMVCGFERLARVSHHLQAPASVLGLLLGFLGTELGSGSTTVIQPGAKNMLPWQKLGSGQNVREALTALVHRVQNPAAVAVSRQRGRCVRPVSLFQATLLLRKAVMHRSRPVYPRLMLTPHPHFARLRRPAIGEQSLRGVGWVHALAALPVISISTLLVDDLPNLICCVSAAGRWLYSFDRLAACRLVRFD